MQCYDLNPFAAARSCAESKYFCRKC